MRLRLKALGTRYSTKSTKNEKFAGTAVSYAGDDPILFHFHPVPPAADFLSDPETSRLRNISQETLSCNSSAW